MGENRRLRGRRSVGCEAPAAAHVSPPFLPHGQIMALQIQQKKIRPRWVRFSLVDTFCRAAF
jgi:hypothetical protein